VTRKNTFIVYEYSDCGGHLNSNNANMWVFPAATVGPGIPSRRKSPLVVRICCSARNLAIAELPLSFLLLLMVTGLLILSYKVLKTEDKRMSRIVVHNWYDC